MKTFFLKMSSLSIRNFIVMVCACVCTYTLGLLQVCAHDNVAESFCFLLPPLYGCTRAIRRVCDRHLAGPGEYILRQVFLFVVYALVCISDIHQFLQIRVYISCKSSLGRHPLRMAGSSGWWNHHGTHSHISSIHGLGCHISPSNAPSHRTWLFSFKSRMFSLPVTLCLTNFYSSLFWI